MRDDDAGVHAGEVARLRRNLALTTFLLECAANEALSARREVETLTVLVRVRAELAEFRPVTDVLDSEF